MKYQAPLPGRKPSSEINGYNQQQHYQQPNGSRSGYAGSSGYNGGGNGGYGGGYGGGNGGYGNGYGSQKALSVGANSVRKPIRYDAKYRFFKTSHFNPFLN